MLEREEGASTEVAGVAVSTHEATASRLASTNARNEAWGEQKKMKRDKAIRSVLRSACRFEQEAGKRAP